MTQKNYYSVNEVLVLLNNLGLTIEIFGNYVREKLIHPVLYINSLPAHACEHKENGDAIAVGECLLSCYIDPKNEAVPIIDLLLRHNYFELRVHIKKSDILDIPKIFNWEYDARYFAKVPPGHANPKPFSDNLDLQYFILLSKNMKSVKLDWTNIFIKLNDLEYLKHHIATQQKNEVTQPTSRIKPRQKEKTNPLRDLIKEIHTNCDKKTPESVWKLLKNLAERTHELLQEVDPWTSRDAAIYWISHIDKERKMGKRSFQNFISDLNNPK